MFRTKNCRSPSCLQLLEFLLTHPNPLFHFLFQLVIQSLQQIHWQGPTECNAETGETIKGLLPTNVYMYIIFVSPIRHWRWWIFILGNSCIYIAPLSNPLYTTLLCITFSHSYTLMAVDTMQGTKHQAPAYQEQLWVLGEPGFKLATLWLPPSYSTTEPPPPSLQKILPEPNQKWRGISF